MNHWFVNYLSIHLKVLTIVLCTSMSLTYNTTWAKSSYQEINQLISAWQTTEARENFDQLENDNRGKITHELVRGRLLLFEGRYTESVAAFDLVKSKDSQALSVMGLVVQQAYDTHEALKGMQEEVSDDGRFLVRYFKTDQMLIPYLIEVLQKADRALSKDFDYVPPGRVLVEIYPTSDYLAKVSSLSETDIETSGTIALCSDNRLMFTSPRGLARGYGWRDTVTHEFVHYYVTKYSANTVPIWLHEGIAKFQEVRWRRPPGAHLAAPQEDLLARSLKTNQLITFDQMHPSMAKLPSQTAASLAFAEVHTVLYFLYERKGYQGIRLLLQALKANFEMDDALMQSFGFNLQGLWDAWLIFMRAKGLKEHPGLVQRSLKFKRPGEEEEPEAEYDSIENKEVKDWAHIGELLRARGRLIAALRMYQKAARQGGNAHLVIQNGMAAILLALKKPVEIPSLLQTVIDYYPSFFTSYLHLGKAFMALNEPERAILAFEEAVGINPFHPEPHQALIRLYKATGHYELLAREKRVLEMMK
jgi:tetratricopeptide (TPR) repeat protein